MLTIAYFRGRQDQYQDAPLIRKLADKARKADYIIAPIADNRMFEIIDSFIEGEITDIQCRHCLSATNLGNQYVFTTRKALDRVHVLRHCYFSNAEKKQYLFSRKEHAAVSRDKVKIARKQYRNQGKYIEEIIE